MSSDLSQDTTARCEVPVFIDSLTEHRIRVAVVTGGGAGIGRAVARGLASTGYCVAVVGRHMESLVQTAEDHAHIAPFRLDVGDAARSAVVFAEVERQLGQVDILVANAAVYPRVHFLDQSPASFEETFQTNVHGVANAVRSVLPGMLSRNAGRIIVLGSLADQSPLAGACAYSSSKGALHALVRGIAVEIDRVRYPNVLINEFNPGRTRTAMGKGGHPPEAVYPLIQALIDQPPGGPHGRMFIMDREVRSNERLSRAILRRFGIGPRLMRLQPAR
ncbi:SDR family oxidoreductase [Mycolicibacterium goodii]|uniref:SDR family oxidoreductase n=1 Tax=Mycolicibacterium goodii TaxID=134601 RepID=UPI00256EF79E|nr:SDR family oxidoreductase [Mycolicibacterium goodii]